MRFHFGFSKRISFKTLIEFIGFLFVGLLAYFGFISHAMAWSTYENISFTDWSMAYYNDISQGINEEDVTIVTYPYFYKSNNIAYGACKSYPSYVGDSCWNNNEKIQYNQFYSAYSSSSTDYKKHYTSIYQIKFPNYNNFCSSDSSNKSINWKYGLQFNAIDSTFSTSALNAFQLSNLDDLFNVYISAYDYTNNVMYNTSCSMTLYDSSNSIANYDILCNNVSISDTNKTIDSYFINIENKLTYSNAYKSSGSDNIYSYIGVYNYFDSSSCNNNCKFQYECSTSSANVIGNEDPFDLEGLGNIFNDFNDLGIPLPDYIISYPQNIQDIISLPLYVIDSIVKNSSTCSPYELDLSSLLTLSGDTTSTYKIYLPCMRTKLSSLLGALYTLIDVLMASIVFYNIAMAIVVLLECITSGVDLYSYYFTSSKEGLRLFSKDLR